MLRPRKMSRVLIAGPLGSMERAVAALHRAGSLHITDYTEQYPGFRLGAPLPAASGLSEKLLKLRAASKVLGIEEGASAGGGATGRKSGRGMDELLEELGRTVAAKEAQRHELETRLQEARRTIEALRPFSALPLRLEAYAPMESLATFAGTVRAPVGAEVARITPRHELFASPDGTFIALFVDRRERPAVEKLLSQYSFSEAKPPLPEGDPSKLLGDSLAFVEETQKKLLALAGELRAARETYLLDILACQEALGLEVEKAEAPLRFAASRSSFIVEGWIPSDEVDRTENGLLRAAGTPVYLERIDEREWAGEPAGREAGGPGGSAAGGEHGGAGEPAGREAGGPGGSAPGGEHGGEHPDPYENVPVALANPRPVKPFEMLTEMFSTPAYKEIDPTITMAIVFPFFFGLMIGDLAYGILLAATGLVFMTRLRRFDGFRELGWYIFLAGIIAALFGTFVFGDAFGIPFHAMPEAHGTEAMSWSSILGVEIPLKASVHKLEASGLGNLLMFSILAAVVHLSLGNILGVVNEWGRSRKHAAAKVGWLLIVLSFGLLILKFGESTSLGRWLWDGALSPFSASWDPGIGLAVPYATILFLIGGAALVIAGEGPIALTEIIGTFSNILSYTRLGAIGVAKGAMAFAFNILIIPMVAGGNIGLAVFGGVLLVLAHFLVFVLGSLSSGIQALRLNLVEYFMKFFRGGGVKFIPFGREKKDREDSSGA